MTKVKSARPKRNPIKSAKQAERERLALQSYWSAESQLTQRLLIYVASLLEKLIEQQKPRKISDYQKHVAQVTKAGGTLKEAAQSWNERQAANGSEND